MPIVVACLGWGVGLLINLLADSLPRARRLHWPRCEACGAPRPAVAWSGLVQWVTGRRRCEYCSIPRGLRAGIAEIISIAAALALFTRDPAWLRLGASSLVTFLFLLIVVIDLEHRLIPHAITLPAAILIGAVGVLDPARGAVKTLAGGAAGFALVYLLYLLGGLFGRLISRLRGRALEEIPFGFGDVTLAGVIGLAVGWPGVIVALFIGILAAGLFSAAFLLIMLARRRYTAFIPIPYGPFLVLGAAIVYFGGRTALERVLGG
jgi:leader peptidase (prepilin peptidase)/N-methyltransferase